MICAFIQARMGSSRLPNKVLLPLGNETVLKEIYRRVSLSNVDFISVLTTEALKDDAIVQYCELNHMNCYRGSEEDVLDRYFKAASYHQLNSEDLVIRITGDCPFIDFKIINRVIDIAITGNYDYVSNTVNPTFPDGLDVEIFNYNALKTAHKSALKKSEREHVTPYLYNNRDIFRVYSYQSDLDLSNIRLTLDEHEDYEVIKQIYENLTIQNTNFGLVEILEFIKKNAAILDSNKKFYRNSGYEESLKND